MTQQARFLTPSQVVERLALAGVSVVEETVRSWARSGQVTSIRMPGGRYLFRPEDIDAILTPIGPGQLPALDPDPEVRSITPDTEYGRERVA